MASHPRDRMPKSRNPRRSKRKTRRVGSITTAVPPSPQPTYRGPLHDFELAPLIPFPATIFSGKKDDRVGALILSLSLAFNDLKNLAWFQWQIESGWDRSKPDGITAYEGQLHGMRAWYSRMVVALLHEVLLAIREAQKADVLDDPELVACLPEKRSPHRKTWDAVLDAALGQAGTSPLHRFLLYVRNNAAYHYYQPKALANGYHRFYHGSDSGRFSPRNAAAYASLGGAMELTRFYFADAAAQVVLADLHAECGIDAKAVSRLLKSLNNALRYIVEAYLLRRADAVGFTPDS
jgi:hypothetical protein